jgi:pSer/pThr/pTyr-binding forkhead associated (FHA) protein/nitrogen fixation-related uncharacterized protein
MAQLIVRWGHQEHCLAITTPQVSIGRADSNFLQLKSIKISRYHCQIVQAPAGYLLSDSGSANGTFLNGQRIERNLLRHNDNIRIGNIEIAFQDEPLSSEGGAVPKLGKPLVISDPDSPLDRQKSDEAITVMISAEESRNYDNKATKTVPAVSDRQVMQRPVHHPPQPAGKTGIGLKQVTHHAEVFRGGKGSNIGIHQRTAGIHDHKMLGKKQISDIKTSAAPKVAPKLPAVTAVKLSQPSGLSVKSRSFRERAGQPVIPRTRESNPQDEKKKNLLYLIGGVVALVVVIVVLILYSISSGKTKEQEKKENEVLEQIEELYKKKEYSEALEKYQLFLKEFKGSKHTSNVKEIIKKLEELFLKEKEGKERLSDLISKAKDKNYPISQYPGLLKEFEKFIKEYKESHPALVTQAESEKGRIARIAATEMKDRESTSLSQLFEEVKTLRKNKDYDTAITKLEDFLKQSRSLNERQKERIKTETKDIENERNSQKK